MKSMRRLTRVTVAVGTLCLLLMTAGCAEYLLASHLTSFSAGWIAGRLSVETTAVTTCFRNGEPIDCAELPP